MSSSEDQELTATTDEATKFFLGARSALKIGDMKAAERLLRRALDISPENYNYMLALARLLVQADKPGVEAEELLLASAEININAVEPRLILSAMYEKQGEIEWAGAILRGVLNIDSSNFIARRKCNQLEIPLPDEEQLLRLRNEILQELEQEQEEEDSPAFSPTSNQDEPSDSVAEIPKTLTTSEQLKLLMGEIPTQQLDIGGVPTALLSSEVIDQAGIDQHEIDSTSAADPLATALLTPPANSLDLLAAEEIVPALDTAPLSPLNAATEAAITQRPTTNLTSPPAFVDSVPAIVNNVVEQYEEEEHFVQTVDIGISRVEIRAAILESVKKEIIEKYPPFLPEIEMPQIDLIKWRLGFDELGNIVSNPLITLDPQTILDIMRDFFFAVDAELDHQTARLLFTRAKTQIAPIFPALDIFEIVEEHSVVEFASNDPFITPRSLEAVVTWIYLFVAMVGETAINPGIRERVIKRAMPIGKSKEEELFQKQFKSIQF